MKDKRIMLKGLLKREEVLRLQKSCMVLLNPRPSHHEYTKYIFQSKSLEYMSSGTPVITSRLPGIPKKYYDYVYLIED